MIFLKRGGELSRRRSDREKLILCVYKISLILIFLHILMHPIHADLQSAVDSIKLEIEKNPDDYKLHFKLGLCYYSLDQFENALSEFTQVLSIKEDHKTAIMKLVLVYGHLGEYQKMIELCTTTMQKLRKPDYYLSYECGIANAMLGNYDVAIKFYNDALLLSPYKKYESDKELQLAMIYQCVNDTTKANELFNKSLEGISKYGKSYEAIWHFWVGKFDYAYEILSKEKKEYMNEYNLGVYQIASGDVEGLATLKSACDKDTTGFVRAVYNAMFEIKSKAYTNAEMHLKRDIPSLRRSGIANGLLAWTLEKLGKESEAKKYLFRCYGRLPLGIDVESMRSFIDRFVQTLKESP